MRKLWQNGNPKGVKDGTADAEPLINM